MGKGGEVGVEVAGGAAELAADGNGAEQVELCAQTIGEDGNLLAEFGGRGGLAVGACQHGDVGPLVSHGVEACHKSIDCRDEHLLDSIAQRHGDGRIVDVL